NYWSPDNVTQVTWTYPRTNRLLIEAGTTVNNIVQHNHNTAGALFSDIPVVELTTNFEYNAKGPVNRTVNGGDQGEHFQHSTMNQHATVSYVTGSHTFKAGVSFMEAFGAFDLQLNQTPYGPVVFQFRNGSPSAITEFLSPQYYDYRLMPDSAVF